jgi:GST-like protein
MESTSHRSRLKVIDPTAIQLYSAATPNGMKIAISLEELVQLRGMKEDFKYEPHTINIRAAENYRLDFLNICPNGKIPAMIDPKGPGGNPVHLWESGSCLLYLAEKYEELIPIDPLGRLETINWLFWASTGLSVQV